MIEEFVLINLGFRGHEFTWNNKRGRNANIQERLDMGIVNVAWRVLFPKATVAHLPAIDSYHNPTLLNINPNSSRSPHLFSFESMWVS